MKCGPTRIVSTGEMGQTRGCGRRPNGRDGTCRKREHDVRSDGSVYLREVWSEPEVVSCDLEETPHPYEMGWIETGW